MLKIELPAMEYGPTDDTADIGENHDKNRAATRLDTLLVSSVFDVNL